MTRIHCPDCDLMFASRAAYFEHLDPIVPDGRCKSKPRMARSGMWLKVGDDGVKAWHESSTRREGAMAAVRLYTRKPQV